MSSSFDSFQIWSICLIHSKIAPWKTGVHIVWKFEPSTNNKMSWCAELVPSIKQQRWTTVFNEGWDKADLLVIAIYRSKQNF